MSEEITVNCPTCGKIVVWNEQSPHRPFLFQTLPAYRFR
ncbi:zinc-binding protein [Klebsiella grimontii]|uniref:Zinc-binding protein n=1 Tax=Klebsiella grimontii TaxID=2058152 RepID=A0A7H4PA58_9ENTR|nr:zinc-binding protein [Klebsiella grimontii]